MLSKTTVRAILLGVASALLVAGPSIAAKRGSLVTQAGTPSIFDNTLRDLLDTNIPAANAQSTLLVFTQCYGGDTMDNFAGRAGTTVISATSPGELATYGGYDDDAAAKLKPGETAATVHAAGSADAGATPSTAGPDVGIPVTNAAGPVKSRHVLIYAGRPGGGGGTTDIEQRDTVKANFAADSVTTVGGAAGAAGWDHPGTLAGLTAALKAIKPLMNPDEQFIMYVTDHGNLDEDGGAPPNCVLDTCDSPLLVLGSSLFAQMLSDPQNDPAVSLVAFGPVDPGPVSVFITGEGSLGSTNFQPIDLNDDGDLLDSGEGWQARIELNESLINPNGEFVTVVGAPGIVIDEIILESGGIRKIDASDTPAPPSDIPALGTWGIMLLVLGLAVLGSSALVAQYSRTTARPS